MSSKTSSKDKRYTYKTAAIVGVYPLTFVKLSYARELGDGSFSWIVKTRSGNIYEERECNLFHFCM